MEKENGEKLKSQNVWRYEKVGIFLFDDFLFPGLHKNTGHISSC